MLVLGLGSLGGRDEGGGGKGGGGGGRGRGRLGSWVGDISRGVWKVARRFRRMVWVGKMKERGGKRNWIGLERGVYGGFGVWDS